MHYFKKKNQQVEKRSKGDTFTSSADLEPGSQGDLTNVRFAHSRGTGYEREGSRGHLPCPTCISSDLNPLPTSALFPELRKKGLPLAWLFAIF